MSQRAPRAVAGSQRYCCPFFLWRDDGQDWPTCPKMPPFCDAVAIRAIFPEAQTCLGGVGCIPYTDTKISA